MRSRPNPQCLVGSYRYTAILIRALRVKQVFAVIVKGFDTRVLYATAVPLAIESMVEVVEVYS